LERRDSDRSSDNCFAEAAELMSIYDQFVPNQLDKQRLGEGEVYPLLRKVGDTNNYTWAYAIEKVKDDGFNCILAALLQSLGFKWDQNQNHPSNN